MTILDSLILGIVEGLTEFLPISSTAHLMLASRVLGLDALAFVKTFEIAIQSGAMMAVIALYWRSFLDKTMVYRILAAFIPTAVIGLALYKVAKEYLLDSIPIVAAALLIGGIVLIIFEWHEEKKKSQGVASLSRGTTSLEKDIKGLSWGRVVAIGAIQALAIIPGVSRSGATIIGGRLLGMSRMAVVEFSFLLAVPTILAATVLDVYKNQSAFASSDWLALSMGFISAGITAFVCIRWLLAYIRSHSFVSFGVYRIVIAVIVLFVFL